MDSARPSPRTRRILSIVDASLDRSPAVEKALALARALHAEIWLGLFDRGPRLGLIRMLDLKEAHRLEHILRKHESERLAEFADRLRDGQDLVVRVVDEPQPLDTAPVAAAVRRHEIDLVFKDAGSGTAPWRHFFHSLDAELLRECPVPLWLAGPEQRVLPSRIAAAVDPIHPEHGAGSLNDAVLDWANLIARSSGARLEVVSSFCDAPPRYLLGALRQDDAGRDAASFIQLLRGRHAAQLDALLDRHGIPRSNARILEGPPASALDDQVATDQIVVGVAPRSGLLHSLAGGTAKQLVLHARCDVLAVPEPPAPAGLP
jgi:universal stress protein E